MSAGSRAACGGPMRSERSNGQSPTLPRVAWLLPRSAREEWFAPALADLRADYHERRARLSPRAGLLPLAAWYAASTTWLFVETLRLAVQAGVRDVFRPAPRGRSPRKDWPAMLIRDVRGALR